MSDYKVIDNVLDKETLSTMQSILLGNNFPYYFMSVVTGVDNDKELLNHSFFGHLLYSNYQPTNAYGVIKPLLDYIKPKSLIRAKINLYTKTEEIIVHKAHVDFDYEHNGALFYVNNNDGYTLLEDGTKIESVENRLLLFKSYKKHSSTTCTNEKIRVNININYF